MKKDTKNVIIIITIVVVLVMTAASLVGDAKTSVAILMFFLPFILFLGAIASAIETGYTAMPLNLIFGLAALSVSLFLIILLC